MIIQKPGNQEEAFLVFWLLHSSAFFLASWFPASTSACCLRKKAPGAGRGLSERKASLAEVRSRDYFFAGCGAGAAGAAGVAGAVEATMSIRSTSKISVELGGMPGRPSSP